MKARIKLNYLALKPKNTLAFVVFSKFAPPFELRFLPILRQFTFVYAQSEIGLKIYLNICDSAEYKKTP